jgi:thiamine transport system ATP-binding protein
MTVDRGNALELDRIELTRDDLRFRFHCHMPAGLITAIAGPSGSGKTTLLNIIAGFETPDAGRVLLAGDDVTARNPAERPVSLVFQENNLFAHLDLFTNVGLGISPSLRLSPQDKEHISAALARTGLAGYGHRMPGTLSGGERQRAAFARVLVRNRPFLLLDEPFAALDPSLRLSMAGLLKELQAETGVSVLLVSHDPEEVRRLADRVIFLDHGSIIASETTPDFFTRPGPQAIIDFRGKAAG